MMEFLKMVEIKKKKDISTRIENLQPRQILKI